MKLMKVAIAILRKLNILLILDLDNILLITISQKKFIMARDTLIFVLQNLGFLVHFKKSVIKTCQRIWCLGTVVDSIDIKLTIPQEKENVVMDQCQLVCSRDQVTVWKIVQLIWNLCYSAVAVLSVLSKEKIMEFSMRENFKRTVCPT